MNEEQPFEVFHHFPRTPVGEVLLDLLKQSGIDFPTSVDAAYELAQYAVQTRYPGE